MEVNDMENGQYDWKDLWDAFHVKTSLENSPNHLKAKKIAEYFLKYPEKAQEGQYASLTTNEIKHMCSAILI